MQRHRIVVLGDKASASRAEDPRFESRLREAETETERDTYTERYRRSWLVA